MVAHRRTVGTIGVRRQHQYRLGTGLRGLFDPADGLHRSVRGDAGHDAESLRGRLNGHLDHASTLLRGEGLVLTQRAGRADAVGPVCGKPRHMFGVRVVVDAQVVVERQRGRGVKAPPRGLS